MTNGTVIVVRGKKIELAAGGTETDEAQIQTIDGIRAEFSSLLRAENVAFLLGAGCSRDVGGMVFGKVEQAYWQDVISHFSGEEQQPQITALLNSLLTKYRALLNLGNREINALEDPAVDFSSPDPPPEGTAEDQQETTSINYSHGNLEEFLTKLYNLHSGSEGFNIFDEFHENEAASAEIGSVADWRAYLTDDSLSELTSAMRSALVKKLDLVSCLDENSDGAQAYIHFVRKLASRPHTLSRPKIFTLNYDLMIEWASDKEGVVLIDGFRGSRKRFFRPEVYDQEIYYPAGREYSEPRKLEQVLHLYKLHGSLNWVAGERTYENPFGVSSYFGDLDANSNSDALVIHPIPTKYAATHSLPLLKCSVVSLMQ